MSKSQNSDYHFAVQKDRGFALDVHKEKIVACIMGKDLDTQIKEFGTYTDELEALRDWLVSVGLKEGILESTGVYWEPVYRILSEAGLTLTLANAQYIKQIPGRKTDINDAQWLCKLLLNGLTKKSFVPTQSQKDLRILTRHRYKIIRMRSQTINRITKLLESGNYKVRSVITNMNSRSGITIAEAIAQGVNDADQLSQLLRGRARKKQATMKRALNGFMSEYQREALGFLLEDYHHYNRQIERMNQRIKELTSKLYQSQSEDLQQIVGIGRQSAEVILSEAGSDMEKFPSENHLTSWAGLSPGNHQSASQRKPSHIRPGNHYLRTAMIQIAWVAVRQKKSYWRAMYYNLAKRMVAKKAIVAIARKILKMIYRILSKTNTYRWLDDRYYQKRLA